MSINSDQIIPVEEDDHFDTMQIFAARSQRVAVIMGSDSDLSCMKDAAQILEQFGVGCDVTIVSAHRTPTKLYNFAQTAAERGVQVIIAGAGGAAHLPGMVAALTPLPVIGVPIKTSAFNGNDSLLSIVQVRNTSISIFYFIFLRLSVFGRGLVLPVYPPFLHLQKLLTTGTKFPNFFPFSDAKGCASSHSIHRRSSQCWFTSPAYTRCTRP